MTLENLGFDNWFQERQPETQIDCKPARIMAVNRDNCVVHTGTQEVTAEISGKLQYAAESNIDLPTVGDWVMTQFFDSNSLAIIHNIFPRKSLLKRKTPDKQVQYQLIGANIDTGFIMQGLDGDFNLRRLERYLVMIRETEIAPVILLTKSDLVPAKDLKQKIKAVKTVAPKDKIISLSNISGHGLKTIQKLIATGQTLCLLGSSGVGKTTLLNRLLGDDTFATNEVRENDGRGRHTTSRRQLILLQDGGMIIDTPGLRELGNVDASEGIEATFSDIRTFADSCRFKDCTHTREPGCAVQAAIESGELSEARFQSFQKLSQESAHHKRSYLENRQRDKKFSKMYKDVIKHKKSR